MGEGVLLAEQSTGHSSPEKREHKDKHIPGTGRLAVWPEFRKQGESCASQGQEGGEHTP